MALPKSEIFTMGRWSNHYIWSRSFEASCEINEI